MLNKLFISGFQGLEYILYIDCLARYVDLLKHRIRIQRFRFRLVLPAGVQGLNQIIADKILLNKRYTKKVSRFSLLQQLA